MSETRIDVVKVGLVDDHPMVREGVGNVVKECAEFELVLSSAEPSTAFAYLEKGQLDILLLDVSLGAEDGLTLIEKFLEAQPTLKVVILTVSDNESFVVKAFARGACGYLLKECDRRQITTALRCAASGVAVLGPYKLIGRVFQGWLQNDTQSSNELSGPLLTDRELEVLKLVAAGRSNRDIAKMLFLAESTIKKYSHNAMGKLGTTNRGAAAIRAMRLGMIDLEESLSEAE